MHYVCPAVRCWLEVHHERTSDHSPCLLTRWERVYSVGMAKFTREEVIEVVSNGRKCEHASLQDIDLSGAGLSEADLTGTDLSRANLTGAKMEGVHLLRANLWKADLRGAELSGANFAEANLSGADLSEAYLSGANLQGANQKGAGYNADTKWPDEDFDPVAKGAVNEPSGRSMNRWLANG